MRLREVSDLSSIEDFLEIIQRNNIGLRKEASRASAFLNFVESAGQATRPAARVLGAAPSMSDAFIALFRGGREGVDGARAAVAALPNAATSTVEDIAPVIRPYLDNPNTAGKAAELIHDGRITINQQDLIRHLYPDPSVLRQTDNLPSFMRNTDNLPARQTGNLPARQTGNLPATTVRPASSTDHPAVALYRSDPEAGIRAIREADDIHPYLKNMFEAGHAANLGKFDDAIAFAKRTNDPVMVSAFEDLARMARASNPDTVAQNMGQLRLLSVRTPASQERAVSAALAKWRPIIDVEPVSIPRPRPADAPTPRPEAPTPRPEAPTPRPDTPDAPTPRPDAPDASPAAAPAKKVVDQADQAHHVVLEEILATLKRIEDAGASPATKRAAAEKVMETATNAANASKRNADVLAAAGLTANRTFAAQTAWNGIKSIFGVAVLGGLGYGLYNWMTGDDDSPGGTTPEQPGVTRGTPAVNIPTSDADLTNMLNNRASREDQDWSSDPVLNEVRRRQRGADGRRKRFILEFSEPYPLGRRFAFVNQVPNGEDVSTVQGRVDNAELAKRALSNPNTGGEIYRLFKRYGSEQQALNDAVEAIIGYGLYNRRRVNRFITQRRLRSRPGAAGRARNRDMSRRRRRLRRRTTRATENLSRLEALRKLSGNNAISSGEDMNRIDKLKEFNKIARLFSKTINNQANNDDLLISKKADDISESYHKDAVKDLNHNDSELRSYFTGLGRLYDEKSEPPKEDYKTLYDVHEETGADLVNSAHPKSVVVSDAIGNGGLVENGLEQNRQTHGVAMSTPTGNYRANYAWVREVLKKTSK